MPKRTKAETELLGTHRCGRRCIGPRWSVSPERGGSEAALSFCAHHGQALAGAAAVVGALVGAVRRRRPGREFSEGIAGNRD
jgi:hypothetical protein